MDLLIKGALAGLTLSFLIGPVFFAIVQTGVEKGFRAGLAFCTGIWISDVIIILLAYLGLSYIVMLVSWDGFAVWIGSIGGLILVTFGLGAVLNKSKLPNNTEKINIRRTEYLQLVLKGMAINTLNPFTMVFWLGLMSTVIAQQAQNGFDAGKFFGALLVVMITFDVLKIGLSKKIRNWISVSNVEILRRSIGFLLIAFGVILFLRVWILA